MTLFPVIFAAAFQRSGAFVFSRGHYKHHKGPGKDHKGPDKTPQRASGPQETGNDHKGPEKDHTGLQGTIRE